jgi:hypothetical protein
MHSLFHAPDAYRMIWNFHQVESRWLFEPQLGLASWVGLLVSEGAWYPMLIRWWAGSGPLTTDGLLAVIAGVILLVFCGGGVVVGHLAVVRRMPSKVGDLLGVRDHPVPWVALAGLLLLVGAAGFLRGDRGLELENGERMRFARRADVAAGSTARFAALLDLAPHGDYQILGRVQGVFRVTIDGEVIVESADEGLQRHLFSSSFRQPSSGLRLLEVELTAPEAEPGLIELYWTWPGEGVLMGPLGGEYVQPTSLTAVERLATRLWRQRWTMIAFGVSFLVLAGWNGKPGRIW